MFSPVHTRIKPLFGSSALNQAKISASATGLGTPEAHNPLTTRLAKYFDRTREETGHPANLFSRSRNQWFQVGTARARDCLAVRASALIESHKAPGISSNKHVGTPTRR